jgi:hypothetical protein
MKLVLYYHSKSGSLSMALLETIGVETVLRLTGDRSAYMEVAPLKTRHRVLSTVKQSSVPGSDQQPAARRRAAKPCQATG